MTTATSIQATDLRGLVPRQDLNLGPHPYQGSAPGPVSPGSPPATWANDAPLETVANRSVPMACGPNVGPGRARRAIGCPATFRDELGEIVEGDWQPFGGATAH
jgi:hypothetical protein